MPQVRVGHPQEQKGEERRQETDRRGLLVGLKFKTSKPVGPIEDWLNDQFPDAHHFMIESMSDDLYVKEIKVVFATTEQRERFKTYLSAYIKAD